MDAIYTAASGLKSQQQRLDIIADNIANVNTAGYKSSRMDFKDAIYTAMLDASDPASTANLAKGHGSLAAGVTRNYSDGTLQATSNALDFAIEGEGFFAVMDPSGQVSYTRSGAFYLTPAAEGSYLVNSTGYYVLDQNGEKILLKEGAGISSDGSVEGSGTDARIGVFTFANNTALSAAGGTSYTATAAAGQPVAAQSYSLKQSALESSNVDLALEMTRMLRTQRAFSLSSRALQTADDMDGLANNIRR